MMDTGPLLRGTGAGAPALLPWGEWDRPDGLETISRVQCYAVFVNAIIGTGVFALPFAVHSAGWLLALGVLAVCAFFGWLTAGWTIESCARAGALMRAPPAAGGGEDGGGWRSVGSDGALNVDASDRRGKADAAATVALGSNDARLMLGWERTDFAQLARLFLGPWGQRGLVWMTAAQCWVVLWAYTSVFSISAAGIVFEYGGIENGRCVQPVSDPSNASECEMVYYICVAAFATMVIPLTLLEIEEQANVQLALTAYRFLALGVMIATLGVAMARTDNVQATMIEPAVSNEVNWIGFAAVFNAAAVAFNFQLNMPDALRPLVDKSAARSVMQASFGTVVMFYVVMSLMASTVLGDHVLEPVTLNWREYNANGTFSVPLNASATSHDDSHDIGRPKVWWVMAVQLIVLCFPIIDQVSVYPIVGNAMANNMAAHFVPWCLDGNAGGERFTARERYLVKTGIRLLCAVPPIFLGAIAGNLSTIFGFAGLASFFLEFLFPALFQWYSVSTLKAQTAVSATTKDSESWLDGARTPYSNVFSGRFSVSVVMAFGVASVSFAFLQLIAPAKCEFLFWDCHAKAGPT